MSLWTPWVHQGDLISKNISRLISLEARLFGHLVYFSACVQAQNPESLGGDPDFFVGWVQKDVSNNPAELESN